MQSNWDKRRRAGRDLAAKQFEKCGVKLTQLGRDSILAQKKNEKLPQGCTAALCGKVALV